MTVYLIGSLRNPLVPLTAARLRQEGFDVFDDWFAAGERADDSWQAYEIARGHSFQEALRGHAAKHVFQHDLFHLHRSHVGVLVLPAGRSGHLELGFLVGQGKSCFTLLPDGRDPDRYDVMAQYATVVRNQDELLDAIKTCGWPKLPTLPFITAHEAQWLAGLLEGDGMFCISGRTPRLVLQMTDKDVVDRAATLLGSNTWGPSAPKPPRKPVWACGATGLTAIEWMRVLRYMLGERRRAQILTVVKQWLERKQHNNRDNQIWARWFGI